MSMEDLHRPLYIADVLANALNNGGNRALLHQLEGPTLSAGDMRDETSNLVRDT